MKLTRGISEEYVLGLQRATLSFKIGAFVPGGLREELERFEPLLDEAERMDVISEGYNPLERMAYKLGRFVGSRKRALPVYQRV